MVFEEFTEMLDVYTDALVAKFENEGGMMSTEAIIGLVIGIVVLAALLPTAIAAINNANQTGWSATQTAIWGILGLIILAVVIMKVTQ
jgi:hypothetical protein